MTNLTQNLEFKYDKTEIKINCEKKRNTTWKNCDN